MYALGENWSPAHAAGNSVKPPPTHSHFSKYMHLPLPLAPSPLSYFPSKPAGFSLIPHLSPASALVPSSKL